MFMIEARMYYFISSTNYFILILLDSLVPQGGLVCTECPLGLNIFLSTRPPKSLKNIRYYIFRVIFLKMAQSDERSPRHSKQVRL